MPADGNPDDAATTATTATTPSARQRLLDAAVDHAAHHGVSGLSLRQLAAALGTSHRMLIYHFGSKEALLTEIVRTVEARQRTLVADLPDSIDLSSDTALEQVWAHFADEALWPWERLFFEVYGQALQGHPHARGLLDEAVDAWLDPVAALLTTRGTPADEARTEARLMLAVTRGLLLDLLATGDRAAVDAVVARFAALVRQGPAAGGEPVR